LPTRPRKLQLLSFSRKELLSDKRRISRKFSLFFFQAVKPEADPGKQHPFWEGRLVMFSSLRPGSRWRFRGLVFLAILVAGCLVWALRPARRQPAGPQPNIPDIEEWCCCRPLVPAATCRDLVCPGLVCLPVSAAFWSRETALICNYQVIQEVDLRRGTVHTLWPTPAPRVWQPTGLCVRPTEGLIYVANYTGHDVLVYRRQQDGLHFVDRWAPAGMQSPENVACSPDGRWVAVADYDGNRLWVFQDGRLAWSRPIARAHGVACGPDFVVVSSLEERTLYRFDFQGRLQERRGLLGWGPDRYLWPTCLQVVGQSIYVSDAHTGKISILDFSLRCREWFGGNGPALGLFNMPYGLASQAGDLLLCDTFNNRLVLVDAARRCQLLVTPQPCPTRWHNPEICWHFRRGYENQEVFAEQSYPGLARRIWFASYGQLASAAPSGPRYLIFPETGSLFNPGGFPYFCWCLRREYSGESWLLLGHSQGTHVWIVDYRGRCFRRAVTQPLWLVEGQLRTGAGVPVDPSPWIAEAVQAFQKYQLLLASGTEPLEALRQVFWPGWTPAAFHRQLDQTFVTPAGQAFWRAWRQAATAQQRRQALAQFDASLENQEQVLLAELWLRCLLDQE
jgi:hypothetical protein